MSRCGNLIMFEVKWDWRMVWKIFRLHRDTIKNKVYLLFVFLLLDYPTGERSRWGWSYTPYLATTIGLGRFRWNAGRIHIGTPVAITSVYLSDSPEYVSFEL